MHWLFKPLGRFRAWLLVKELRYPDWREKVILKLGRLGSAASGAIPHLKEIYKGRGGERWEKPILAALLKIRPSGPDAADLLGLMIKRGHLLPSEVKQAAELIAAMGPNGRKAAYWLKDALFWLPHVQEDLKTARAKLTDLEANRRLYLTKDDQWRELTGNLRKEIEQKQARLEALEAIQKALRAVELSPEETAPDVSGRCVVCHNALHQESLNRTTPMSVQEMAKLAVAKAYTCPACKIVVCGSCCSMASEKRGEKRLICPRCSKEVRVAG